MEAPDRDAGERRGDFGLWGWVAHARRPPSYKAPTPAAPLRITPVARLVVQRFVQHVRVATNWLCDRLT